jgi:regulator of sirC expression with transglutaminase-like and TPR domain
VADERLDYTQAKLAFDRLIDPSGKDEPVISSLDAMAEIGLSLAGADAASAAKLVALKKLIYEGGSWNDHRPFSYDHSDPLGQNTRNKLLSSYLSTRLGNCISMPILFLVLGEKMGLDVSLGLAPLHMLVRCREESARVINLETTSGGHPARDVWYQSHRPMSRLALANGIYMRSLSRREGIAHMATTVVEHLLRQKEYAEAIRVSEVVLEHFPRDVYALVKQGTAYAHLLEVEFYEKYRSPTLIPAALRPRYAMLCEKNEVLFAAAEALGWEPFE